MQENNYFCDKLEKFKNGDLPFGDAIDLCQNLVDSGQLWKHSNETNIQVNNFINSGHVYKR